MGLQSLVVKQNATAITPTGGTDVTFTPDGQTVPNGLHVADAAQADFRIRRNITFRNRPPALQPDGTYSKAKLVISYSQPKLLASGKTTFNVRRLEIETHPETTAAEQAELDFVIAQLAGSTGTASFRATGSLA